MNRWMINKLAKIYIHSVYLTERIFYSFYTINSWWSGIQSEVRRSNGIREITEHISCLDGKEGTLRISCRKCIRVATVIGSGSSDSHDSRTIIELEDDSIRINSGSCRSYCSCIPGEIYNISIFLYSGDDIGKCSCSNRRTRSIFGECQGGSGTIIGLVGFVVGMHCDTVHLTTRICERTEVIRPVCVAVCSRDCKELL